jgi:hypothetical protein
LRHDLIQEVKMRWQLYFLPCLFVSSKFPDSEQKFSPDVASLVSPDVLSAIGQSLVEQMGIFLILFLAGSYFSC